ncbi:YbaB/EbfC family nucleoid-associated protein [Actinomadura violacea]|uniref:YbaB/EbfC family nucleoid-associated protein n=1 Tax=Actinomadura violacea TaxID=2819934 RepID=A0ABS3RPG6_9ACTN|nr:YbaB/EbfC family nucleoid-associated protein [Actinomadura violacea]MBO2458526.1 YbaB/EbfC family nucleoid-associated protein [Actinomadura violacea]
MGREDNKLRDQLNFSVPVAPRTDQEVIERKQAAVSPQGSQDDSRPRRATDSALTEPEGETLPPMPPVPRRNHTHSPHGGLAPPSPETSRTDDHSSLTNEIQEFSDARQKELTLAVEEASRRQYLGGSGGEEVYVKVDGNGRILDLHVSHRLLKTEQSRTISALLMSAIAHARSKAASDWMAALSLGIEAD